MNYGLGIAALLLALVVAGAVYVRVAPTQASDWHVDPLTADPPRANGVLIRPENSPVVPMRPEEALAAFDDVALATARTERIAGGVDAERITYVTRSALWGFPDYTTVTAVDDPGGSRFVVLARARFGQSDLGVNEARVSDWLSQVAGGNG